MNRLFARCAVLTAGLLMFGLHASATDAGTIVRFGLDVVIATENGNIDSFDVELFDDAAPITVANFLKYVNDGLYEETVIHRTVTLTSGGISVVQGGGFTPVLDSEGYVDTFAPISTFGNIQNEFNASRSNVAGTIAMAMKGSDLNSASSQWFVNTGDNSAALDPQSFTVFGRVIGGGMELLNEINMTPACDISGFLPADVAGAFTDVPMYNDGGNFIAVKTVSIVTPTPEPASLASLAIAGLIGGFFAWRRRNGR